MRGATITGSKNPAKGGPQPCLLKQGEDEPKGVANLKKLYFYPIHDVCSDDVNSLRDFDKFYLLEDGGKKYHWLKDRSADKNSIGKKPKKIPITYPSDSLISFKAIFKVISDDPFQTPPAIRVKEGTGKFVFEAQSKGKVNGEFEILFIAESCPFEDTIQYIETFMLGFEYSEDEVLWHFAGSSSNTLYLTWKKPMLNKFQSLPGGSHDMVPKYNEDGNPCILESLLWYGCKEASGLGKNSKNANELGKKDENEKEILDAIFQQFKTLKLKRRRDGEKYLDKNLSVEHLGYWRGNSATDSTTLDRGLRALMREGESRCGEFTMLLRHVAWCQGIELETVNIYSGCPTYDALDIKKLTNGVFLVKTWNFQDMDPPTEVPSVTNKAQGNKNPLHFFWDHVFAVHTNKENEVCYYDPSYGLAGASYHKYRYNLIKEYTSQALSGVLFALFDDNHGKPFFDASHSQKHVCPIVFGEDPFIEVKCKYRTARQNIGMYLDYKVPLTKGGAPTLFSTKHITYDTTDLAVLGGDFRPAAI